jgi:hypothetical protein
MASPRRRTRWVPVSKEELGWTWKAPEHRETVTF